MNLNDFVLKKKSKLTNQYTIGETSNSSSIKKRKSLTNSSHLDWGRTQLGHTNTTEEYTTTFLTENDESRVVVALTHGRGEARLEIGLACLDLATQHLILCQIADGQNFLNTLTKINIFNPNEIVIPITFVQGTEENRLIKMIKHKFPHVKLTHLPRKNFNKSHGMDRIRKICLPNYDSICIGLQYKYYALAATAGLLIYLQNNLNIFYTNNCLRISYQESEGYAIIDISTADRLELVASTRPTQANRHSSLYAILNHCYTRIGARTLRAAILQPPFAIQKIEERQHCVSELIKHPDRLLPIQMILQKLTNIDQLLTLTTIVPNDSQTCTNRQLNYLLLLNGLIDMIEPLNDKLNDYHHQYFLKFIDLLKNDEFNQIKISIRNFLHPNAHFAKGQDGLLQRCFAIKSGLNGLLDLVRKTYSERLNEMHEYIKKLGEKYHLPLNLGNTNTKGYHIILHLNNQQKRFMKKTDLPTEFIQIYRLTGSFTMKTMELINYSTRLDDIMLDILKISNSMVHKLLIELKKSLPLFYQLCENLAKLDMYQSLAQASLTNNYKKPKFGDYTEIQNGVHPLLDLLCNNRPIANDFSISKKFNIQIITGPNGSGKSIYIRQMMLLQIMAQIGCYIPANKAIIKPVDRMFARIYLNDNMEFGASAFMLEMTEIKYMMTIMTNNSLFIIDELCRSTSLEEGTALAIAICEQLTETSNFLLITTHFTLLTKLYDYCPNVKILQMETIAKGIHPRDMLLEFKYNAIPGIIQLQRYGVFMAKYIWPENVMDQVYQILDTITVQTDESNFKQIDPKIRIKYELEWNLEKLKLTTIELNKLLMEYVNEILLNGIEISVEEITRYSLEKHQKLKELENNPQFPDEITINPNLLIPDIEIETITSALDDLEECSQIFSMEFDEMDKPQTIKTTTNPMESIKKPKKLTKREIMAEFNAQDREIYEKTHQEPEMLNKFAQQLINRPTIKQIQNAKHLIYAKKNDNGLIEILPIEKNEKKKKLTKIQSITTTTSDFNMEIFSDKNAQTFNQFLQSNEHNYKMFNFHLNTNDLTFDDNTIEIDSNSDDSDNDNSDNVDFSLNLSQIGDL